VKARLKEVFDRLGVCNRTELASALRAHAASYQFPASGTEDAVDDR